MKERTTKQRQNNKTRGKLGEEMKETENKLDQPINLHIKSS